MIHWFVKRFLAIFDSEDPEVMFLRLRAQVDLDVPQANDPVTQKESSNDSV